MSVGYETGGGVSGLWSSLGRVCCERRDCSMVIWLRCCGSCIFWSNRGARCVELSATVWD